MLHISKVLHNETSVNFFSFIVGMGLVVMLFHKPIPSKQTLSLPVSTVENKMIKQGNKCYKYIAEDSVCQNPTLK